MKINPKNTVYFTLNKTAIRNEEAKRSHLENDKPYLNPFQLDRQRIVYSKAFRRLNNKTQVYISPKKDHYRTRLSHTLEVATVARMIARTLRFNEDLVEAIALGHDLGHTPFGHMGEKALNIIASEGFTHYNQSVRVVEFIERVSPNYTGLNLTDLVINGIKNHSGDRLASSMEGQIVKFSDRICYINHDLEDAFRAEMLEEKDIPKSLAHQLGFSRDERLGIMVEDLINHSSEKEISMSPDMYRAMMTLRKFLFENVYYNEHITKEQDRIYHILKDLYNYYSKYIHRIPQSHLSLYDKTEVSKEVIIIDYLSGMTDNYIINTYKEIFIPNSWTI